MRANECINIRNVPPQSVPIPGREIGVKAGQGRVEVRSLPVLGEVAPVHVCGEVPCRGHFHLLFGGMNEDINAVCDWYQFFGIRG